MSSSDTVTVIVIVSTTVAPLEGLVMGTRSGDMDPAIIPYLMRKTGADALDIDRILNKKSGVLGITEKYVDRRDVQDGLDNGDEKCLLAQDLECYRIKKYIGAYTAALGRVDALIFTAGVGELNPQIRQRALEGLENIGIKIDKDKESKTY